MTQESFENSHAAKQPSSANLQLHTPHQTPDPQTAESHAASNDSTTSNSTPILTPPDTPDISQGPSQLPQQPAAATTTLATAARGRNRQHDVVDPSLILDSSTRSGRIKRNDNAFAILQNPYEFNRDFLSAFAVSSQLGKLQSLSKLHVDHLPPPPKNWYKVKGHKFEHEWLKAAKAEFVEITNRNTWEVVNQPPNAFSLPLTWVFKYKTDADGFVIKFKARICVRGDLQLIHSDETYAATLAARVFRFLMALVAAFDLETQQWDAVNAFLNSPIDRLTYVQFLQGFESPGKTLRLLRALYGLKQSPKLWFDKLCNILEELGLKQASEEACLFANKWLMVFFYVDDIVAIYHHSNAHKFQAFSAAFEARIKLRTLGEISWFLGIRVIRDRPACKLYLLQDTYIEKIAQKFSLAGSHKSFTTPLPTEDLTAYLTEGYQASPGEVKGYAQKTGSINYAATFTRPDCSRAASYLARFATNPHPKHQVSADRVIGYLHRTKNLAIAYGPLQNPETTRFKASSDAAFADDPPTRRSSSGYTFSLFCGLIDWAATLQRAVTTSTTEAELHALSTAAKMALWWQRLFVAIEFDPNEPLQLQCDNQQTIRLLKAETPRLATKLRHVDVLNHWLREKVQQQELHVDYCQTSEMVADGMTKALTDQKHQNFVAMMGLQRIIIPEAAESTNFAE